MSERLNLDTSSLKTYFGRPNLIVLQIACADFGHARELVVARASNNMYPGLGASDPLSVLIESKRDIRRIKLLIADPLPGTMPATEYRMRIPASKESTIRRKGKKVLSHTSLGDWLSRSTLQSDLDWFRRQRLGGWPPTPRTRQRPRQLVDSREQI